MQTSYQEQLADGRWLRKKNQILERDNYTCTQCGATSHLNVHHTYYEKGKNAWEYPNGSLITLCEACHAKEHKKCKPYFGEVYVYDHSDFTNFLICYGINYAKREVYLLGIDNGGSLSNPVFECISLDEFPEKCTHLRNFWDFCYDDEKNYWHEVLIRCLLRIYQNKDKDYYVYGYRYDKEAVYDYARKRISDIVESHELLKIKFYDIANE